VLGTASPRSGSSNGEDAAITVGSGMAHERAVEDLEVLARYGQSCQNWLEIFVPCMHMGQT